jgi:hypothetical protein
MSRHFALDPEMTDADWEAAHKLADAVHAAGTKLPKDLTPPSERPRKVPNRQDRRVERKDAKK